LNKQFSVYLDAVRITAALLVFLTHLPLFIGGWLWQLGGLGHEAVVLFFVLSGYVISYVTKNKETVAIEYIASRFARIYSVAFPALIITILLYYLGNYINPEPFSRLNERLINPFITTVSALLFINQSWWGLTVFSNMPYWSLGYEVLYYVFFGVLCFLNGIKRVFWLIVVMIIMGPSILLYLPVWLLGVLCHRITSVKTMPIFMAYVLYLTSLILVTGLCFSDIQANINEFAHGYVGAEFIMMLNHPAEKFGADYLLALAIAMNIVSFYFISARVVIFNNASIKIIRFASSYTFSLYLFHMPILFFISALIPYSETPFLNIFGCLFVTIILIVILGNLTEKKKSSYKRLFFFLSEYCSNLYRPNKRV